jgi:hypothetical protein
MTPKEKAKELTLKFMKIDSDSEQFVEFKIKFFYAQRCALMAVDEVIQAMDNVMLPNPFKQYWNKVKQEIQAL